MLGVRFRTIGYAAVAVMLACAGAAGVATAHVRAHAALQSAVATRSALASRLYTMCRGEIVWDAISPTALAANQQWVAARSASFPLNCVLPSDRAQLEQVMSELAVQKDPLEWQMALVGRNELVRSYASTLNVMVTR